MKETDWRIIASIILSTVSELFALTSILLCVRMCFSVIFDKLIKLGASRRTTKQRGD